MSDNVKVEYGDSATDTAVLLLAAVEEMDLDPSVVKVDQERYGFFEAPADVVKKAGLKAHKEPEEEVSDRLAGPTPDLFAEREAAQEKPEPKKAVAKKAAAEKNKD